MTGTTTHALVLTGPPGREAVGAAAIDAARGALAGVDVATERVLAAGDAWEAEVALADGGLGGRSPGGRSAGGGAPKGTGCTGPARPADRRQSGCRRRRLAAQAADYFRHGFHHYPAGMHRRDGRHGRAQASHCRHHGTRHAGRTGFRGRIERAPGVAVRPARSRAGAGLHRTAHPDARRQRLDGDDARARRLHGPRLGRLFILHAAGGRCGRLRGQPRQPARNGGWAADRTGGRRHPRSRGEAGDATRLHAAARPRGPIGRWPSAMAPTTSR